MEIIMIVETSTCVNIFGNTVTQTYILHNGSCYCHSSNGAETLIFPAEKSNGSYRKTSNLEILDFALCEEISRIANQT